jgi:DNA-binding XRE family transcriptional regulator
MKIGPRRLPTTTPRTDDNTARIQQQATLRDVEQAKIQNTVTLGRQTYGTKDLEKKLRNVVTPRVQKGQKAKPESPATKVSLENTFLTTFGEELSPGETKEIMGAASSSIEQLKSRGKKPDSAAVMAAHTYNFSKKSLQEALPQGTTLSDARKLANSHPEIAGKLALLDSASAYMKRVKQNESSEKPESKLEKPSGISRETIAQLQADSIQTMLEVANGWQQVLSQYQRSAAERYKLTADTSQEISDIYQRLHLSQAKSQAKHAKQYVYLLSEVWPEA